MISTLVFQIKNSNKILYDKETKKERPKSYILKPLKLNNGKETPYFFLLVNLSPVPELKHKAARVQVIPNNLEFYCKHPIKNGNKLIQFFVFEDNCLNDW